VLTGIEALDHEHSRTSQQSSNATHSGTSSQCSSE